MNMAYKKYREMKVYEASGYQYKRTPSIILKGKWLSELGFDIGEQIEVKCEDGRLIITKANEIWSAEAWCSVLTDLVKAAKINIIMYTKEVIEWQGEKWLAFIL